LLGNAPVTLGKDLLVTRIVYAVMILLCAAPVQAEQALILTEIEQIQEKIWYLQRDLASQKTLLEAQQDQLAGLSATAKTGQQALAERIDDAALRVTEQQAAMQRMDRALEELDTALSALTTVVHQRNRDLVNQAEKTGSQQSRLQALGDQLATHQVRTEKALAETRDQLAETRSELAHLQQSQQGQLNRVVLWGGGAALVLAVLLTIVLALRGRKADPLGGHRNDPTDHEL